MSTPFISVISPNSGTNNGGQFVTISGSGLLGATSVMFGTNSATTVLALSDTSITCTTPQGTAGLVNVIVTVAGITSNSSTYTYSTTAPYILSITPNSGTTLGGQLVTITGTNLTGGTVKFGTNPATNIVATATSITCTTPQGTGQVNVIVTGSTGITSNFVTYTYSTTAPIISSITPNS
jgi:hypothetical protein